MLVCSVKARCRKNPENFQDDLSYNKNKPEAMKVQSSKCFTHKKLGKEICQVSDFNNIV